MSDVNMGAVPQTTAVLSLTLLTLIAGTGGLYVDRDNPYKNGTLPVQNFTLTTSQDDVPLHTVVYYPARAGVYAALLFIGGFAGAIPVEIGYTDLLSRVAAHGFVVMGMDLHIRAFSEVGGVTGVRTADWPENFTGSETDKGLKEVDWARKHLDTHLSKHTAGVSVDWERAGLFCHSAGCAVTLRIILKNHTVVNATAFLEPFSSVLSGGSTVNFRLPALMYGTELCLEFPYCCVKGKDWNDIYGHWSCPRALLATKNQGHCDVLDHKIWEVCQTTHFCKTGHVQNWVQYHTFMQGVVSAFFISTLQGVDDWHYVTNPTDMPIGVMNATNDMNCQIP